MLLIDAHLDLSLNAVNWNRDLTRPVADIRRSEYGMTGQGRATNTVALPDMRRGEVAICIATVLARSNPHGSTNIDFKNQAIASAMAQGQLAYYNILESQGQLRQLRTWRDVESHLQQWNNHPDHCPLGYIFSMEGADPILSAAHVAFWWDRGLRAAGISHFGVGSYAHGTGSPGGLTARGPDLLRAMREAGMVLDVTHLADDAFWQAIGDFRRASSGPATIIAEPWFRETVSSLTTRSAASSSVTLSSARYSISGCSIRNSWPVRRPIRS